MHGLANGNALPAANSRLADSAVRCCHITVSLAAFLAFLLNAPSGAWSTIWRDSYLWHVVRFHSGRRFVRSAVRGPGGFPRPRALSTPLFPGRVSALQQCSCQGDADSRGTAAVPGISARRLRQGWLAFAVADASGRDILPYGCGAYLLAHRLFCNLPMASRLLPIFWKAAPRSSASSPPSSVCAAGIFFRFVDVAAALPNSPVAALIFMPCFASFAPVLRQAAARSHHYRTGWPFVRSLRLRSARAAMLALTRWSAAAPALVLLSQRLSKSDCAGMTLTQGWRDPDDRLHSRLTDALLIVLACCCFRRWSP